MNWYIFFVVLLGMPAFFGAMAGFVWCLHHHPVIAMSVGLVFVAVVLGLAAGAR